VDQRWLRADNRDLRVRREGWPAPGVSFKKRTRPTGKIPRDAIGGKASFRQDVTGIFTTSAANGSISDEDKAYVSAQIAAHTGLSERDR
jgi:hypothetical protein